MDALLPIALFACSIVVWLNVREIFEDKCTGGVSLTASWIFLGTNVIEVFYFWGKHDPWSAGGAVSMAVANVTWLWLAYYYRRWALYYL
jgi:hypothetical protein